MAEQALGLGGFGELGAGGCYTGGAGSFAKG